MPLILNKLLTRKYVWLATFISIIITYTNLIQASNTQPVSDEISWIEHGAQGKIILNLYFFWSKKCPHCLEAQPFVEQLPDELPWLRLHSYELSENPDNVKKYRSFAKQLKITRISVPAFVFCGNVAFGYDTVNTTGQYLKQSLISCYEQTIQQNKQNISTIPSQQNNFPITIPLVGELTPDKYSLPVFTVIISLMDSINPCAFFVLLFLLSLLTHTHSRNRMLFIGATFVFFSGLIYFLFMAAWLNMFMLFGSMHYVTLIAGLLASVIALINIKDFFLFKKGFSLSIPDKAKPKLFQRMRNLINVENKLTLLFGTIILAILANTYELLCTAGFPMVYTRYLTLQGLPVTEYYAYLIFYNLVYILPLSTIVIIFAFTLGSRKLKEQEGKLLKLISGFMMLGLGLILIFAPNALNNISIAALLVFTSILIASLVAKFAD